MLLHVNHPGALGGSRAPFSPGMWSQDGAQAGTFYSPDLCVSHRRWWRELPPVLLPWERHWPQLHPPPLPWFLKIKPYRCDPAPSRVKTNWDGNSSHFISSGHGAIFPALFLASIHQWWVFGNACSWKFQDSTEKQLYLLWSQGQTCFQRSN